MGAADCKLQTCAISVTFAAGIGAITKRLTPVVITRAGTVWRVAFLYLFSIIFA